MNTKETTFDQMTACAQALLDSGMTKVEVVCEIVRLCRELGLPDSYINEVGFDFYREISKRAAALAA